MNARNLFAALILTTTLAVAAQNQPATAATASGSHPWTVFPGGTGPGNGRHIVFIAAEESYRSEESMPAMARVLARHGFKCTVLFAIDPTNGTINPMIKDNIPGLEALESADVKILADNGHGEWRVQVPAGWSNLRFFELAGQTNAVVRAVLRDDETLEELFLRTVNEPAIR